MIENGRYLNSFVIKEAVTDVERSATSPTPTARGHRVDMIWTRLSVAAFVVLTLGGVGAQAKRRHRNEAMALSGTLGGNRNMESMANGSGSAPKHHLSGYNVWTLDTYPNPQKEPTKCGRHVLPSFLCDPDGILSPSEADDLDSKLNKICEETKCACQSCQSPWFQHQDEECHGYKIAVAIVYSLNYTDSGDVNSEGRRWTTYLREGAWKFGMCGDDIIILLLASLQKVFTAVGPKAAEILTPECVTKGVQDSIKHIDHAQYLTGLKDMVNLYGTVLKTQKSDLCNDDTTKQLHPAAIAVIALFSAFTVVIIIGVICCVWGTCKKGSGSDTKRSKCPTTDEASEYDGKVRYDVDVEPRGRTSAYVDAGHTSLTAIRPSDSVDDEICEEAFDESYPMNKSRDHVCAGAHARPTVRPDVKYRDEFNADQIVPLKSSDSEMPWKSESYEEVNR